MYDDNITHYRKHQHTITLIVSNEPGMLARVAGLFMRRNFNIEALTVAQSTKPEISRMTISFKGDDKVYEQLAKQLNKVVTIVKVSDLPPDISIIRELALIKIHTKGPEEQKQLMAYCQAHEAKVAHVNRDDMTVEIVGSPHKIDSFLELVKPMGIKELARTGATGLFRGNTGFEKL